MIMYEAEAVGWWDGVHSNDINDYGETFVKQIVGFGVS